MSKDDIINELIRIGVFKAEDGRQLWELSSVELIQMLKKTKGEEGN